MLLSSVLDCILLLTWKMKALLFPNEILWVKTSKFNSTT